MRLRRILRLKKKILQGNERSSELAGKRCIPCEGGIPPLTEDEIKKFKKELVKGWKVIGNKKIFKAFSLVNYKQTIDFVNKIANISEEEGHHPVLHVFYARLEIEIYTFAIDALSLNDFILAAKIDQIKY